jgi:RimJ/RimL family protein N-acetyltransferase
LTVLETERLCLRHLAEDDAPFILELVNDPDWLRFIGDRGVRTLDDARAYILNGPVASYARHGFGLYLAELRDGRAPVGMCGLLKRDWLDDVDVGFAFLARFRGKGLAHEAARATLDYGTGALGLGRIAAIVSPENAGSMRLLEKLGMRFRRMALPPDAEQEVCVYAT